MDGADLVAGDIDHHHLGELGGFAGRFEHLSGVVLMRTEAVASPTAVTPPQFEETTIPLHL
jgi:hypothetical protein